MKIMLVRLIVFIILISMAGCDGILKDKLEPIHFEWVKTWGGEDNENNQGVVVDNQGNIYIYGKFDGTTDFDPGPESFIKTCTGESNAFLTKLSSDGSHEWTITIDGKTNTSYSLINTCLVDTQGKIYISGSFAGEIDFDFGNGNDIIASTGVCDGYLSILSPDRENLSTYIFSGTERIICSHIQIDDTHDIYIAGQFTGNVDFNPFIENDIKTSVGNFGNFDIFTVKISSDEKFVWAITIGNSEKEKIEGLAVDNNGNLFLSGNFTGTLDFNPNADIDNKDSIGQNSAFFTRIDTLNHNYFWTYTFNATNGIYNRDLILDRFGNIFLAGYFRGEVDFDPYSAVDIKSAEYISTFIINFNPDFSYAKTTIFDVIYPTSIGHNFGPLTLKSDSQGNLYISGIFIGVVDFNPGPNENLLVSEDCYKTFCTRLNYDGSFGWSIATDDLSPINDVSIDLDSNIYFVGTFSSSIDFDPSENTEIKESSGENDAFIMNLSQPF